MTVFADPVAVRRQAKLWGDTVLQCRTLGHNWEPKVAVHNRKDRYFYLEQHCARGCGTIRHQEMSERGHIFAQWYGYLDGFLSLGLGRIVGEARDELRVAVVGRQVAAVNNAMSARSHHTRNAIEKGE